MTPNLRPLLAASVVLSFIVGGFVSDTAYAADGADRLGIDLTTQFDHVLYADDVFAGTKVLPRPALRGPKPKMANIQVEYINFPANARAAFERAVDIWEMALNAPIPIRIEANWTDTFPGTTEMIPAGVLGATGEPFLRNQGALPRDIWFPDALANQIVGSDVFPGEVEILMVINSGFPNWYFGTDGNPGAAFDLVTVVLHEIGHGLGMAGVMRIPDTGPNVGLGEWSLNGNFTNFPAIYDTFAEDTSGDAVADPSNYANPSFALANALRGTLFFDGPNARDVFGGRIPIFTPSVFAAGSSYSHFDEQAFNFGDPNSLMTPQLAQSEVIHDPGDLFLCTLEDFGWDTVADCGGTTGGMCEADDDTFCLQDGRFEVEVNWRVPDGRTGVGRRVTGSVDSGLFYFFNPNNWEMLVKVLDACDLASNRFWVFAAATTNVEYTLTVTDTQAGVARTYFNPQGVAASAITDTNAFDTCP